MTVCVLAGGVGAARLLRGMQHVVDDGLVAVANVGDDEIVGGLYVSPDLDTIVYTCAGAIDPERGWGLARESWRAMESLRRYAGAAGRSDIGWFSLGDQDLGTHLYRTTRLAEGAALSTVTAEIARAWDVRFTLLPATDDRLRTVIGTPDGPLAFQEYFVRERHDVAVDAVVIEGAEGAAAAPGVLEAIGAARAVVIAPSNPVVSIEPVLAVPGVRNAVRAVRGRVVAVSPIVGGRALKGPADRLLADLGHEASVVGVARLYASVASTLVVDEVDAALAPAVEAEGLRCVVAPSVMHSTEDAAALSRTCLAAVDG